MAVRRILEYPDPFLRQTAAPVTDFDPTLARTVDDLVETLYSTDAIGLCAPQIGIASQVLVIDLSPDRTRPQVFINPEVIGAKAWGLVQERCLSVPGVTANVWRATQIRVRYDTSTGEGETRDLTMMDAVCLQHERDHFDGKLLVDKLGWWKRRQVNRAVARES